MMCEPQAGHWTSKHTGSPWDAFGQPYTRTRLKAGVACSQHSVISTGLPLSVFTTSLATVCLFLFFSVKHGLHTVEHAHVSLSFGEWLRMRDSTICFSGPLPVLWLLKRQWLWRRWGSRKAEVIEGASWWQRWALCGWRWGGLSATSWPGWWAELYSLEATQPRATSSTPAHSGSPGNTDMNQ